MGASRLLLDSERSPTGASGLLLDSILMLTDLEYSITTQSG